MPLYGFICQDCQEEFEELVMSAAEIDDVSCPSCESGQVQRKISLAASISRSGKGGHLSNAACTSG
jgi:putative FmdB family regulatory protein